MLLPLLLILIRLEPEQPLIKREVSHRVAAVVAVLKKKDSRSFRLHEFLAPVKAKKKQEGFFLKSVVGLVVLAVLGGAGYFGLESSGISVSGLIGVDIAGLFGKQKEAKIQTGDSGRPVLAATSESRLLLPQPGIDVQSDINFAALRPQTKGLGHCRKSG